MVDGLEVNQDLDFERREWWALRIGWSVIFVFLTLAVVGLLGPGWISTTTLSNGQGDSSLRVRVDRLERYYADTDMTIQLEAGLARDGRFLVDLDRRLALAMEIQAITPAPDAVETTASAFRYAFTQRDPGADLHVRISYRPTSPWGRSGTIAVPGGPSVDMWTFTYL